MQYLVIFTPKASFGTTGKPSDFLEMEAQQQMQAQVLYGKGDLRQVWALDTMSRGAAVIFEAGSPEHLQGMIDGFPLIMVDYADYQIWPLAAYPGFLKKP